MGQLLSFLLSDTMCLYFGLAETVEVVRRRLRVAALHDFAAARAEGVVADDTEDQVTILPVLQDFARDWEGERIDLNRCDG